AGRGTPPTAPGPRRTGSPGRRSGAGVATGSRGGSEDEPDAGVEAVEEAYEPVLPVRVEAAEVEVHLLVGLDRVKEGQEVVADLHLDALDRVPAQLNAGVGLGHEGEVVRRLLGLGHGAVGH